MASRITWNSHTGFILAALGSAIGLGNIWRFPYIAYRNGGGAFLIPYFVALLVVGIPLLILEFGIGHRSRRAFPHALKQIHPRFSWIGWWSVCFVMFGIVAYYAVVIAWCANYLFLTLGQPWGSADNVSSYFDEQFLGYIEDGKPFPAFDDGFRFGRFNFWIMLSLVAVWFATWEIIRRGLRRGIELASKIFIPILIGLTAILVMWSWNFEGAEQGRELYTKPNWEILLHPRAWIDAFTQIFFTLSLAFGIMIAYASYLPKKTDVPLSAFLAGTGNCLFSVFAAFAVFSSIGMLAEKRGVDLNGMHTVAAKVAELEDLRKAEPERFAENQSRYEQLLAEHQKNQAFDSQMKSFGLIFKTYPAIITEMGPVAGRLFGSLFFLSLVVAGISSSISIVEAFLAALTDKFDVDRKKTSGGLCIVAFLLGLVFCSQAGLFWLDLVDHFITTYGLLVVAIAECLIVGWYFSSKRLRGHLDQHRQFRSKLWIGTGMRLLMTAVLLLTWLALGTADISPAASGLGRFLVLVSVLILWLDEHWLDFDLRLLAPALLIFLLDQALIEDIRNTYGGYPRDAILGVGLAWLAATLLAAVIIDRLPETRRGKKRGQN